LHADGLPCMQVLTTERAPTLTDVMQEVLRLQRLMAEKSAALDETRAVHADTVRALALLQDSAEDMAARL